jgi:hypothetical protein
MLPQYSESKNQRSEHHPGYFSETLVEVCQAARHHSPKDTALFFMNMFILIISNTLIYGHDHTFGDSPEIMNFPIADIPAMIAIPISFTPFDI